MMRALAFGVLLGAVGGCSATEPATKSNEANRGPGRGPDPAAAPTPAPGEKEPPAADPFAAPAFVPPENTGDEAEEKEEKDEPERDLGAELKQVIGSPVGCLEPRPASEAPERIVISVNASVMGSGRVSRASVSAGGLKPKELDCIQRQAESRSLPRPVDDAPLSVSTSIELELQKPPAKKPEGG